MNDTIIQQVGGGPIAVLVILMLSGYGVLGLVIRALWNHILVLQAENRKMQADCSKETRDIQVASNATLANVERAVNALASLIQDRRRE